MFNGIFLNFEVTKEEEKKICEAHPFKNMKIVLFDCNEFSKKKDKCNKKIVSKSKVMRGKKIILSSKPHQMTIH